MTTIYTLSANFNSETGMVNFAISTERHGSTFEVWACQCEATEWRFTAAEEELYRTADFTSGLVRVDESHNIAKRAFREWMGY